MSYSSTDCIPNISKLAGNRNYKSGRYETDCAIRFYKVMRVVEGIVRIENFTSVIVKEPSSLSSTDD